MGIKILYRGKEQEVEKEDIKSMEKVLF